MDSDASDYGLGAVTSQWHNIQDGDEKVIAYASRVLEKPQASVQHHQGDVDYGVRYQAFPPLPVWETLQG